MQNGALPIDLHRVWDRVMIAPIPTLVALRDDVLRRSTKRKPKWKFRLAPDMVLQLQPQTRLYKVGCCLFHGVAKSRVDADATLFERDSPLPSWSVEFRLFDRYFSHGHECLPGWGFKTHTIGWHREVPREEIFGVHDRLVAALSTAFESLRPDLMLKSACLICGKQLTDPLSMARWIGPECYGSATSIVPYMVPLAA
jgi:hypothetical protein